MTNDSEISQLKVQMVELQSQLAFQEDTLQALNDVITRQQQQIENLHELCTSQKSQLDALNSHIEGSAVNEKPPHY